jgi:hypothetical protein
MTPTTTTASISPSRFLWWRKTLGHDRHSRPTLTTDTHDRHSRPTGTKGSRPLPDAMDVLKVASIMSVEPTTGRTDHGLAREPV